MFQVSLSLLGRVGRRTSTSHPQSDLNTTTAEQRLAAAQTRAEPLDSATRVAHAVSKVAFLSRSSTSIPCLATCRQVKICRCVIAVPPRLEPVICAPKCCAREGFRCCFVAAAFARAGSKAWRVVNPALRWVRRSADSGDQTVKVMSVRRCGVVRLRKELSGDSQLRKPLRRDWAAIEVAFPTILS